MMIEGEEVGILVATQLPGVALDQKVAVTVEHDDPGRVAGLYLPIKLLTFHEASPSFRIMLPLILAVAREFGECEIELPDGFAKEVMQNLPMEFAVEAQKLVGISLEGSVG